MSRKKGQEIFCSLNLSFHIQRKQPKSLRHKVIFRGDKILKVCRKKPRYVHPVAGISMIFQEEQHKTRLILIVSQTIKDILPLLLFFCLLWLLFWLMWLLCFFAVVELVILM